jgi:hypothetical protein
MLSTASQYHLHFSAVRTISTSLVLPIGLLASINLVAYWSYFGRVFLLFFVILIVAATLFLNVIFSGWSQACRRIERYYEVCMGKDVPFDYTIHGFRHIFRVITPMAITRAGKGVAHSQYYLSKSKDDAFPTMVKWVQWRWLYDPFVAAIFGFDVLYLLAFACVVLRLTPH